MPTTPGKLTDDDIDTILGDAQRRELLLDLLEYASQSGPPPSIVVSKRDADPVSHLVAMKYDHIPELEAYGIIDWNVSRHEITPGPNFDQIEPVLEKIRDDKIELSPDGM